jgi:hypothetical protein
MAVADIEHSRSIGLDLRVECAALGHRLLPTRCGFGPVTQPPLLGDWNFTPVTATPIVRGKPRGRRAGPTCGGTIGKAGGELKPTARQLFKIPV